MPKSALLHSDALEFSRTVSLPNSHETGRQMPTIFTHQLANGLHLLAEPVAGAQSLSMSFLTPAGIASEPPDQQGAAALLSEIICRGAGELDARAHCDALDMLGVERGTGVQTTHLSLGATMLAQNADRAIPLLFDMIRRPALDASAMEPSRDLSLQALDSLEDEPQQKVFFMLRKKHYPHPFDRSSMGVREHIETITIKQIREFAKSRFVPGGSVLAFAGKFDWEQLKARVESLLGDWKGTREELVPDNRQLRGYTHVNAKTAQVHIGIAYDAIPEPHEDSILQQSAAALLSGGMSGRLFTEVREKRGLCYAVYAAYASHKRIGAMLAYAGTTAARAQETLDVLESELRRLSQGVDESEFRRAIVGMKSRLVMQGESTGARAGAIAGDQIVLGRPRTLEELATRVTGVTLDRLNRFLRSNPPGQMTTVTIGPAPLVEKK